MIELGRGAQGVVYKIDDHARKNFFVPINPNEDEYKVIKVLSNLDLVSMVKPYNLVHNKSGYLISHDMECIPEDSTKIGEMSIDNLVLNIRNIRKDIILLSNNGIKVGDLCRNNLIVSNNKIAVCDYGCYKYRPDYEHLSYYNNFQLNMLFGFDVLVNEEREMDPRDVRYYLYMPFVASKKAFIEDFIEEEIKGKSANLLEYVKRR